MSGRWWFGLCAAGCGMALAYRGHWAASAVAEATALVPLVLWVRGEMTAQRAMMREAPQPEPVPAARAVPEPRPPWDTAECPVIPPVPRDGPGGGRHRRRRGLRETAAGALRTVRQAYLP